MYSLEFIDKTVQKLADIHKSDYRYISIHDKQLPSIQTLPFSDASLLEKALL